MNPKATIKMANGAKIEIDLHADTAYNEVCSFIWNARNGYYNNHAIERIVPGSWIDVSYTAFKHKECQYFLPNEINEETNGANPAPQPGDICLGYFSDTELSGAEFFFPVRSCEDLAGKCAVIGRITEGMDEIYRLEKVETYPVIFEEGQTVEINCPVDPQVIEEVVIEDFGTTYPEPKKITDFEMPSNWAMLGAK